MNRTIWEPSNAKESIKLTRYHMAINRFGIITILHLLKECEQKEMYEECLIIITAIDECNEHLKLNLPTSLDFINVKEYISDCFAEFSLSGYGFENRLPYYIQEIKQELNSCLPGTIVYT
jgi:hypothetical protein